MKKFELGQTVMTRSVSHFMKENNFGNQDIAELLHKHETGDWGIVSEADKQSNDEAVQDGERILSAYMLGDQKLWVITEWNRSVTTVLFPDDY